MNDEMTKEQIDLLAQNLDALKTKDPEKYLEMVGALKEYYAALNDTLKDVE